MTQYVALLQGVNVGGRGKVDMAELREAFAALGCEDVATYINSGNVLFRDRRKATTLQKLVEDATGRQVAIRTQDELEALCASIPDAWANDKMQKTDVAFFLDGPGEQVWNVLRTDVKPGATMKLERPATVRNVNTVRKLLAMMRA